MYDKIHYKLKKKKKKKKKQTTTTTKKTHTETILPLLGKKQLYVILYLCVSSCFKFAVFALLMLENMGS